jgi:uncharacterized protein (TIGR00251 family)
VNVESVRETREGVLLDVHIVPNSRKEVFEWVGGVLKLKVKAPPAKGKANKDVLRILSGVFGSCRIVTGHSSRKKIILVEGKSMEDVLETLATIR